MNRILKRGLTTTCLAATLLSAAAAGASGRYGYGGYYHPYPPLYGGYHVGPRYGYYPLPYTVPRQGYGPVIYPPYSYGPRCSLRWVWDPYLGREVRVRACG